MNVNKFQVKRLLLLLVVPGCLAGAGASAFEGTVAQVSQLPDPTTTPYTDCLFTLAITPSGTGNSAAPILVALEGFVNRRFTEMAQLRPGHRIRVQELRSFEDMSEAYQSRQIVDDIMDIDLDLYAGRGVTRIDTFSDQPSAGPPGQAHTIRSIQVVPVDESARQQRARTIDEERNRIARLLDPHSDWDEWHAKLEPIRQELRNKLGASGEGYLVGDRTSISDIELSMGQTLAHGNKRYAHIMDSMRMLAREFKRAGTDLLVVPVPVKDLVYAESFVDDLPADRILQPYWYKFLSDCLRQDIEVVDLLPRFQEELAKRTTLYHFNTTDGHLSGEGAIVAAEEIGKRLQRYSFAGPMLNTLNAPKKYIYKNARHLLFDPDTVFHAWRVVDEEGRYIQAVPDSEVLVIGDSMITAPAIITGASVGIHISAQARLPFTFFKRPGSASEISILLSHIRDAGFFSNRKVCIFLFDGGQLFRTDKTWRNRAFISNHLATPVHGSRDPAAPGPDQP